MKLEQANTGEKLTVRLYDRRGRTVKATLRKLRRFMRCHQTGRRRNLAWRLVRYIYTVSRKYKKPLIVYSAVRGRRVAKLKTSKHIRGHAVDFRVRGVSTRALRNYLRRRFKKVGVGYYPHLPFVHLDVRKRSAFWVDTSGSGEGARYERNPNKYVRRERKGLTKPTNLAKPTKPAPAKAAVAAKAPPQGTVASAKPIKKQPAAKPSRAPVKGPPPLGPDPKPLKPKASPAPDSSGAPVHARRKQTVAAKPAPRTGPAQGSKPSLHFSPPPAAACDNGASSRPSPAALLNAPQVRLRGALVRGPR